VKSAAASVTRGEKKLPELMMPTGGSHLSLVAEGREVPVRVRLVGLWAASVAGLNGFPGLLFVFFLFLFSFLISYFSITFAF
jgi:hypothetical protein